MVSGALDLTIEESLIYCRTKMGYNFEMSYFYTYQGMTPIDGATGIGSSKVVKAFNLHPQQLQDLTKGEGFLYRKVARLKPVKIKVNNTGY